MRKGLALFVFAFAWVAKAHNEDEWAEQREPQLITAQPHLQEFTEDDADYATTFAKQLSRWKAEERAEAIEFYEAQQLNRDHASPRPDLNEWLESLESAPLVKHRNIGIHKLIQEHGTDWIDQQYEEELHSDEFQEDEDELSAEGGEELAGMETKEASRFWGRGSPLPAAKTGALTRWMDSLPDATKVSDLNIPGSHDTMSIQGKASSTCDMIGGYVICQDKSLYRQLEDGIRMLDIRLRATKGGLMVHHGPCYLNSNFVNVLRTVAKFLKAHPSEFIIMRVKNEHDAEEGSESFNNQIHDAKHLGDPTYKEMFTTPGCTSPSGGACTVSMMRGKVMMLKNYPGGFSGDETGMGFSWPCSVDNSVGDKCQDVYQTKGLDSKSDKLNAVMQFMNQATAKKTPAMVYVNFWSAQGDTFLCAGQAIKCISDYVNPRVGEALKTTFGKYIGVQAMDFYNDYDVDMIVKSNFAHKASKKGVTISAHWTRCSYMEGREVEYLDRQTVSCSSGVLNGYRVTLRDGAYSCGEADQRYLFLCAHRASDTCASGRRLLDTSPPARQLLGRGGSSAGKAPGAGTGSCGETRKLSFCSHLNEKRLHYLDRQNAYCSGNTAISMFHLQKSGKHANCGSGEMEYRLGCRSIGSNSRVTQKTIAADISNEYIESLDNYRFHCAVDSGLNSFKMEPVTSRRRTRTRYTYQCGNFN